MRSTQKRRLACGVLAGAFAAWAQASSGCSSNHHVSPWGDAPGPPLGAFIESPNLAARLLEVDQDAKALGLTLEREAKGKSQGAEIVARSYVTEDALGRTSFAVRIASPFGVILAAGPVSKDDPLRTAATELVEAVGEAGQFRSLNDLNGDGVPDVILRGRDGRIELWSVLAHGSSRIDVKMEVVATRASDIDGDGRLDLGGSVLVRESDVLRPDLSDVATLSGAVYSNRTESSRAWHARQRDAGEPERASGREAKLVATLEHAWHAILAGDSPDAVSKELAKTKPPDDLRASFESWTRRIARIDR